MSGYAESHRAALEQTIEDMSLQVRYLTTIIAQLRITLAAMPDPRDEQQGDLSYSEEQRRRDFDARR